MARYGCRVSKAASAIEARSPAAEIEFVEGVKKNWSLADSFPLKR